MKSIILSIQSEFYKSRKTAAFWGAIILPLVLCSLITIGFLISQKQPYMGPPMIEWMQLLNATLELMGSLILPMYIIFATYSVNNIEHKANAWKSLFSLPLSKMGIYSGKFLFAILLVVITLFGFGFFTILSGILLSVLKPSFFHFSKVSITSFVVQLELKLLLSSLGILSIQFLFSIIWRDFLKPMGIGLICVIMGSILAGNQWKYAYLCPYSHPLLAISTMKGNKKNMNIDVHIFSQEIYVSIIISVIFFILGYIIVSKKSIE